MNHWLKAWQSQAEVHTPRRQCGCCEVADTRPRKPATHQISKETGLSRSCVVLLHAVILVWSVRRDAIRKSWMKPSAMHSSPQICGHRTAITYSLVNYMWGIIQQQVYQTKCNVWMIWGSVWLMCGLDWNPLLLMMTSSADISSHDCIPARTGHIEYLGWHKLVKTLLTNKCNAQTM